MTDEHEFRALVEPYRAELHAHCYRMLGSVQDAEDALQDTLLRAWRSLGSYDTTRPLRPWLYRIATNASLDALNRRPKRTMPMDHAPPSGIDEGPGRPLTETTWIEPYPDGDVPDGLASPEARYEQRESVELAFVAALQHLAPRQRAVLILREVLGFSAKEAAQSLNTTAASVNSALQRARQTVDERLPDRTQQVTARELGDERLESLVKRYVEAWESRNVDAMMAVLVEDATFAMPPHPHWFRGRENVVAFVSGTGRLQLRHLLTTANGQPAIAWYILAPGRETAFAASLEVLGLERDRVKDITAFAGPGFFDLFGLPKEL